MPMSPIHRHVTVGLFSAMVACGSGGNTNEPDGVQVDDGGVTFSALSGKLGSLGDVKPIVASWVISNSGETLIYLSSAPIACAGLQTMGVGWLSSLPSDAQVVEIVVEGDPKVGRVKVGPGEVNYAPGGTSSAHEKNASSGSITFTKAQAKGAVAGTVTAKYADGSAIMGTFAAEFCPNGSQY